MTLPHASSLQTLLGASLCIPLPALATAPALPSAPKAHPPRVSWISSADGRPWQTMPASDLAQADGAAAQLRVWPDRIFQAVEGFGGCLNELGWRALARATESDRQSVLEALFGDDGCAFALARLPIGANDFALDGYSLAEEPEDYALESFSIERDRSHLLPFVKAAMVVRPDLRCWGSPWSPPAWMKENDNYSGGSLRWETSVLEAYARYFVKWIEAYRAEGVDVYAVAPQNEPNILNVYPTCAWTGEQLRTFIADHLGPALERADARVELWLGTINGDPPSGGNNINDRVATVLDDPAAADRIAGLAFQYDSANLIGDAARLYPEKKLMQSETDCHGGRNSWEDALFLYRRILHYVGQGASSYFLWNLVLDETGLSTWGWRQNAPITVDSRTGAVAYNGEYHVMRHFSQFVKPGAHRVLATGPWGDKIAFANPDGSVVVVAANSSERDCVVVVAPGGDPAGTVRVTLPAKSVNTLVFDAHAREP